MILRRARGMAGAVAVHMSNHRLAIVIALFTACASGDAAPSPDAGAPPLPIDPAGTFAVRSSFSLGAPPAAANDVLASLSAATDGPDDPSRYLIELVIERLPDGRVKTFASELAPYVAAYVNARLATAAPRFVPGVRAIVDGLAGVARRITTIERIEIGRGAGRGPSERSVTRTIAGLQFGDLEVRFADVGESDITVMTRATLAGDGLVIAAHRAELAYGVHLRLGLDRAVLPGVVPGARDLAAALHGLVDCPQLGALIAEAVGLGPAGLYANACTVGLTTVAARIYDRLPAADAMPLVLEVAGAARALDHDGDGSLDAFTDGRWVGTFDGVAVGTSNFEGTGR